MYAVFLSPTALLWLQNPTIATAAFGWLFFSLELGVLGVLFCSFEAHWCADALPSHI